MNRVGLTFVRKQASQIIMNKFQNLFRTVVGFNVNLVVVDACPLMVGKKDKGKYLVGKLPLKHVSEQSGNRLRCPEGFPC